MVQPATASKIPHSVFDTADLPRIERLPALRDSIGVAFDYRLAEHVPDGRFHARVESVLFEHFMLSRFEANAADYHRPSSRIARDGVDLVMVQMYERGPCQLLHDGLDARCHREDVVVMDMSRPIHSRHADQLNLSLCLPRSLLADYVPDLDILHCLVLPGADGLTQLLRQHMRSLHRNAMRFDAESSGKLTRPTMELVAAAMRQTLGHAAEFSRPLNRLFRQRAESAIEQQLADPSLSAETLCNALACSRSRLFAAFEPDGGVLHFVRKRRLHRALQDLRNPHLRHRSITAIAADWCFFNPSSFSRAFRKTFDLTPGDARLHLPPGFSAADASATTAVSGQGRYEDWVANVLSGRR